MARVLAARLARRRRRASPAPICRPSSSCSASTSPASATRSPTRRSARAPVASSSRTALRGVYQKLVCRRRRRRLLGGILVGDADAYPHAARRRCAAGGRCPSARTSCWSARAAAAAAASSCRDDAQVCSCNNVTPRRDPQRDRATQELTTVGDVKACTAAGTGCGGCVPLRQQILEQPSSPRRAATVNRNLCEHFAYTRQELFEIVKLGRIASFEELLASHGTRRRLRGLPAGGRLDPRQHLERLRPRARRPSRTPTTASSPTSSAAAPTRWSRASPAARSRPRS